MHFARIQPFFDCRLTPWAAQKVSGDGSRERLKEGLGKVWGALMPKEARSLVAAWWALISSSPTKSTARCNKSEARTTSPKDQRIRVVCESNSFFAGGYGQVSISRTILVAGHPVKWHLCYYSVWILFRPSPRCHAGRSHFWGHDFCPWLALRSA